MNASIVVIAANEILTPLDFDDGREHLIFMGQLKSVNYLV